MAVLIQAKVADASVHRLPGKAKAAGDCRAISLELADQFAKILLTYFVFASHCLNSFQD